MIWLGALVWAWGNGFERMDWVVLAVLGVLAALAWASDLLMTTMVSRKVGVSWKAIGGAVACGLAGGVLLSEIPVIGTLFGAIIGAVAGMWFIEYLDKRNARAAFAAVRAYVGGTILSTLFEVSVALLMVGIFVWRVWS